MVTSEVNGHTQRGTGVPACAGRTLTPYASQLKAEPKLNRTGRMRMVFATVMSGLFFAGFFGLALIEPDVLALGLLLLPIAGFGTGIVGAIAVPLRANLEDRFRAGLGGVALPVIVAIVTATGYSIVDADPNYVVGAGVVGLIFVLTGGCGAFFGALISNALLGPLGKRARREIRARRWMHLMPRPKLARVDRSDQFAALLLAPIWQVVITFVLVVPAFAIFAEDSLVGLTCTFAGGLLTGLLGAIGIGTDREFRPADVVAPLLLVPGLVLPVVLLTFPWSQMPCVYVVVSTSGVCLGAWLTAIAMLRKRNGVYA